MSQISEYNKVSFITSKSPKMPKLLKETGSLIVLSELTKEKRISLWLRNNVIASGWGLSTRELMNNAEWISKSYNPIFSPTSSGMTYFMPLENIEDTEEIITNDNGEIVGRPQSIHMLLSYGIKFTTKYGDILKEKIDNIEGNNTSIKNDIDNIKNELIPETKTYCCTYASEIANKVKNESFAYTKYWADRIVGGAPDFLDSLGEIKEFLKKNEENDMNVFKKVSDLDKYSIKRKEEENGFSYLKDTITYTYYEKETVTYTYIGYNPDGTSYKAEGTYVKNNEKTYNGGKIAIDSNMINSGIGDIQLDILLKSLLQPYPYKKPELVEYTINDLKPEEYYDDTFEYGSEHIKFGISNFKININKNSSITISNFKLSNDNGQTNEYVNIEDGKLISVQNILNSNNEIPEIPKGNSSLDDILKYYNIYTGYVFEYGKAEPQPYPQLKELEIEDISAKLDTKHAFESGVISNNFDIPIRKRFSYKVFWGISNELPKTNEELVSQNSKFITSKDSTGKLYISNDSQNIWVGLPFDFSDKQSFNPKIFMKSWISGIENDITDVNTNMWSSTKFDNTIPTILHNGIKYYIYSLKNESYTTFAEKISLEIYFNI